MSCRVRQIPAQSRLCQPYAVSFRASCLTSLSLENIHCNTEIILYRLLGCWWEERTWKESPCMCMCVGQGREFLKANIVQYFLYKFLMIWISGNHLGKEPIYWQHVIKGCGRVNRCLLNEDVWGVLRSLTWSVILNVWVTLGTAFSPRKNKGDLGWEL